MIYIPSNISFSNTLPFNIIYTSSLIAYIVGLFFIFTRVGETVKISIIIII